LDRAAGYLVHGVVVPVIGRRLLHCLLVED